MRKKDFSKLLRTGSLSKTISLVIIVFVITLSIGYSAFSVSMNITGIVSKVRVQKDIRVTDLSYSSRTGTGLSTYEEYSVNSLLMGVKLPSQDSTVTYKVTVTNLGNTEMGIFSIDNLPSNLTYSTSEYNLKDKICDDSGKCSLGITKDFYITIGYKANGYNSTTTEYNLKLNIDFREFVKLTYNGNGGTGVPDPQEVIASEDITVDVIISDVIPTRDGYTFLGWADNSDLTFGTYFSGDHLWLGTSNKTIYAVWKAASKPLISVMSSVAKSDVGVDFSQAPVAGVYTVNSTINDPNPIYYYRGAVTNNNVLFADKCWKIVRSTETGGVKLIYNGDLIDGQCLGMDPMISYSAFNESSETTNDVRYLYADGTDSTIKGVIDAWYENNMTAYTSKLEDTPWCMDLSIANANSNAQYYGAVGRLSMAVPPVPNVSCPAEYQLKVSATNIGLKLKHPVSLLTADEIEMAGTGLYLTDGYEENAYLNISDYWWSLSPAAFLNSSAYMFRVDSGGDLATYDVCDAEVAVRPAVSLAPGTEISVSGDGTAANPYVVQ